GYRALLDFMFGCYRVLVVFRTSGLFLDFFFFQAEDGIRDDLVTGVQTCALPIYPPFDFRPGREPVDGERLGERLVHGHPRVERRSEESRVGKECRSRWWGYH